MPGSARFNDPTDASTIAREAGGPSSKIDRRASPSTACVATAGLKWVFRWLPLCRDCAAELWVHYDAIDLQSGCLSGAFHRGFNLYALRFGCVDSRCPCDCRSPAVSTGVQRRKDRVE
jgi:hypothetical protein